MLRCLARHDALGHSSFTRPPQFCHNPAVSPERGQHLRMKDEETMNKNGMYRRWAISAALALPFAVTALACSGSSTTPSTVSSIAVTGAVPAVGATSQFTATATMSNGTTQD